MSPTSFRDPASPAVAAAIARLWADVGTRCRDARIERRLTTVELATRAGVSRVSVYTLERGEAVSVEVAIRVTTALGLRLAVELVDPRKREHRPQNLGEDPVHSAMGEFEAAHLRALGRRVGIDEPYQHYQFAGRADLIAWDPDARALLHIENRTRFPNFQEAAGSYNAKRAYLGNALAERLGVRQWASETHVMVGLWSSEVLHALRLRAASFRGLCPDDPSGFEGWWAGDLKLRSGSTSTFVALDPLASGRQRAFVDLEAALAARPRYRGYAEAASAMMGVRG